MTHQPLTKAEREELQNRHRFQSDPDSRDINRLLADLDAAEADVVSMRNEGEEMAGQVMQRFAELEAQRDRAESELDAERRMRVEAEASSDRAESERATAESIAAQATARMEEMRGERDALKAKLAALVKTATDLREVAFDGPSEPKGAGVHGGREGVFDWKQRIDCESAAAIAAAKGGMS